MGVLNSGSQDDGAGVEAGEPDGEQMTEPDHEPASPGGKPVDAPDPYDIESDLGPDGVPTTEPEPEKD
ncbi:hypothetical protein [Herbiconiux liangxiaofengii]|uniref:hypothetical protein n=1 Tax=Herbiconiux liangxiaofengii TaxID=3342795 RepID=UPI0035B8392B